MTIRLGMVTMTEPGGRGKVCAIQDHFGGAYRRLHRQQPAGEIISARLVDTSRATGESGDAKLVFKILRPVHQNTVRAVLRKIGKGGLPLGSGYWYEVHSD